MLYCSWDIWCVTDVVVIFHFGLFFCPFTSLTAQKIKISKKTKQKKHTHTDTHTQHKTNKKHLEIWSYTCVPKTMIRWSMVPEIWCTTDRQTDGQKKWHIEVGAPLKKNPYFKQNAILFGMKKKRIVNQVLSSKLWYIDQIYTIPKFIKEKIEKTIAQLSIWKCGLGILDIDTQ